MRRKKNNTWQWNEKKNEITHTHTHNINSSFQSHRIIYLTSMTYTTRLWLMIWLKTKRIAPFFLFTDRLAYFALLRTVNQWSLMKKLSAREKKCRTAAIWWGQQKKWNVDVKINLILALYDSIRLECVPLISRCRHVKYCRGQCASWTNYELKKAHAPHVLPQTSTFPFLFTAEIHDTAPHSKMHVFVFAFANLFFYYLSNVIIMLLINYISFYWFKFHNFECQKLPIIQLSQYFDTI